jgi:hypothetical protein
VRVTIPEIAEIKYGALREHNGVAITRAHRASCLVRGIRVGLADRNTRAEL